MKWKIVSLIKMNFQDMLEVINRELDVNMHKHKILWNIITLKQSAKFKNSLGTAYHCGQWLSSNLQIYFQCLHKTVGIWTVALIASTHIWT